VAFRSEPRFTKDVDLAVAVEDDAEAEGIVNRLQVRGYALASLVEQDYVHRLATARLVRPQAGTSSAFIDLLFANSGIEDEIVRRADRLEVLPDVFMPVASIGHLIALKALAGRHQDLTDLGYLISAATDADLAEAASSAAKIEERGFNGDRICPPIWQRSSARHANEAAAVRAMSASALSSSKRNQVVLPARRTRHLRPSDGLPLRSLGLRR
jgi:hypothetical protein